MAALTVTSSARVLRSRASRARGRGGLLGFGHAAYTSTITIAVSPVGASALCIRHPLHQLQVFVARYSHLASSRSPDNICDAP